MAKNQEARNLFLLLGQKLVHQAMHRLNFFSLPGPKSDIREYYLMKEMIRVAENSPLMSLNGFSLQLVLNEDNSLDLIVNTVTC